MIDKQVLKLRFKGFRRHPPKNLIVSFSTVWSPIVWR